MLQLSVECRKKLEENWSQDWYEDCRIAFKDIVAQQPQLSSKQQLDLAFELGMVREKSTSPQGFVTLIEVGIGRIF